MNQAILNKTRKDKFIMVLDIPKELKKMINFDIEEPYDVDYLQFSCFGSPVPLIKIPEIDVTFGGQVHKTSSNFRPAYSNLDVSFFIDNGWKNYYLILAWVNLFNDYKTSEIGMNYEIPDEKYNKNFEKIGLRNLVSRFTTFGLDEYNNKIISFVYTNAFPISIDAINFSHQDPKEISTKVSFAFNQIHPKLIKNIDKQDC
jgi:hypothetical protein